MVVDVYIEHTTDAKLAVIEVMLAEVLEGYGVIVDLHTDQDTTYIDGLDDLSQAMILNEIFKIMDA